MTAADAKVAPALREQISASILRIRTANPFFGVLALFAEVIVSEDVDTAATDGKNILFNEGYCGQLSARELTGLLLHELLHCALEHVTRRGPRDPETWNVAADIVVNGMIRGAGDFDLPDGVVEDKKLAHLSTEEVYAKLLKSRKKPRCGMRDLDVSDWGMSGALAEQKRREIAAHWRTARSQARTIARKYGHGETAGNEWRELDLLDEPQLDWRTLLWEHLVRTPSDFAGFDRRFVGRGLYLDALESESLELWIAVDTSASIDDAKLTEFLTEVDAILATYPRATAQLYFADAELYGPYALTIDTTMPKPKGGGGTSFKPFFKKLKNSEAQSDGELVALYFTDGYGYFPKKTPDVDVLWLVTEDGLDSESFPFGSVVRFDE